LSGYGQRAGINHASLNPSAGPVKRPAEQRRGLAGDCSPGLALPPTSVDLDQCAPLSGLAARSGWPGGACRARRRRASRSAAAAVAACRV